MIVDRHSVDRKVTHRQVSGQRMNHVVSLTISLKLFVFSRFLFSNSGETSRFVI